jgi:hypothetical protein
LSTGGLALPPPPPPPAPYRSSPRCAATTTRCA